MNKRKRKKLDDIFSDSDETFYFIAGYTSNDVPYGITWEEMGMKPFGAEDPDDDEELPF